MNPAQSRRDCITYLAADAHGKSSMFQHESTILTTQNVGTDLNLRRNEDPIESSNFRRCQRIGLIGSCQCYRRIVWNNERHKQPRCRKSFAIRRNRSPRQKALQRLPNRFYSECCSQGSPYSKPVALFSAGSFISYKLHVTKAFT